MQFKDTKKEGTVEFVKIRNKGIGSTPVFKLTLTNPVNVEGYFEIDDIKTQSGIWGIEFSKLSKIAEAFKQKRDIILSMKKETIDNIKNIAAIELEKVMEEAKIDPETWEWHTGCDTGQLYIRPNTELGTEFRPDLRKIENTIEKVHMFDAHKLFGKETEENTVSHETIMKIYNEIIEMRNEQKAVKQSKNDEIFAKAKETGEKQILEQYSVECPDSDESCDIDNVIIYAMPDGTKKITQNHTW